MKKDIFKFVQIFGRILQFPLINQFNMPLRTQILASQINNLSDARYFAAYPVDWMSFVGNPECK